MKSYKCLMGVVLSAVMLFGFVFAAEALTRDVKEKGYNPIVQDRDHCDAGEVDDCADDDCCPESWIGDGFADCEDQAFGCDLTCYDNDGGDCVDPFCGDGACNGSETEADCPEDCTPSEGCADCEFDWSAYGSECCDSAWDEFGIDCATLEGTYGWDVLAVTAQVMFQQYVVMEPVRVVRLMKLVRRIVKKLPAVQVLVVMMVGLLMVGVTP